MARRERRRHRRLELPLPLEYRFAGDDLDSMRRTVACNISSGGLMFEATGGEFRPGGRLELRVTVPPGDGHLPYETQAATSAEVLRVARVPDEEIAPGRAGRLQVAARFCSALTFDV
jgi:hypothetical protein